LALRDKVLWVSVNGLSAGDAASLVETSYPAGMEWNGPRTISTPQDQDHLGQLSVLWATWSQHAFNSVNG